MTKKQKNPPAPTQARGAQDKIIRAELIAERKEVSGPIPPPEDLDKYEKVLPGAAERIMAMAEEQGRHRRRLENKVIGMESRNSLLGIIIGGIIGAGAVGGGICGMLKGHPLSGAGISTGALASLVGVFIYGTRLKISKQKQE